MDTENELFKGAAILAMNRRFPSTDKITIFENKDLASDVVMASMSLKPYKEYVSTRSGSKIASAYVNDRPCLLRYVDLNPNVDSQGDTLVYLSLLKTFTHSQLEQMNTVVVIELGTGKNKETKVKSIKFIYILFFCCPRWLRPPPYSSTLCITPALTIALELFILTTCALRLS